MKTVVAFEVVARHRSFGKAAEELNLTISAVSHQIATLEEYVGRQLFVRSPRGVTLTAAGERYLQSLSGALIIIADARESARTEPGTEVLRLHVTPSFASQWLIPRLSMLKAVHPEIRVRLSVSPGNSDFSRGDIDADIRYGRARWANLHVESVFTEEMMPMISPDLQTQLNLRVPADLLVHDLILCDANLVQWPQWFAANGISMCPTQFALVFDRAHLTLEAATQGLGIVLESDKLAERLLKNGSLIPVFPDRKSIAVHQHHLVYPPQHSERSKVTKFAAWLRQEAAPLPPGKKIVARRQL
jgi:LysR family glycine cleavage system transcriptional activator